jgi:hypothetical protein
MSVTVMSLVWQHYPVGGGELLTALAYADHAHDDGTHIWTSVATIARKTRQSERTIQMHLASMRRTTWLLTEAYARGGYGRATKYRINPAWIANPAGFAPCFSATERVQSSAKKGATGGIEGRKAFAPQPPRTVIEPTTTEKGAAAGPAVVVGHDLRFPLSLSDDARASAYKLLVRCPPELRQVVLDEVAGYREPVRHPLGLLRHLIDEASSGSFIPVAALEHRRQLERVRVEQERQAAEKAERLRRETPEAKEAARRARDEALAKLGLRPRLSSSVVAGKPTTSGGDR